MDKKELLKILKEITKGTGLFPEAMMAQILIESGNLQSQLTLDANNFSGQKAFNISGLTEDVDYVLMATNEDKDSEADAKAYKKKKEDEGFTVHSIKQNPTSGAWVVNLDQPFKKFNTPEEGVQEHINFLLNNPRYKDEGVLDAQTPEEQIQLIKDAGYATDTKYVEKLSKSLSNIRTEFPEFQDGNQLPITADPTDTQGGPPTLEQARQDRRYSRDLGKRAGERQYALLKFREEAIAMLNRKPGSTKLGGDGTGGLKEVAAWMDEFKQLIKDNPVSAVLSDNWDGTKELLMVTEDFFNNKATSISDEVAESFFENKSGMGYVNLARLSDKLYNDIYFTEDNPALNRLSEVEYVENNPESVNITKQNSDGSYNVKLTDGRAYKVTEDPRDDGLVAKPVIKPLKSKQLKSIPNDSSSTKLIDTRGRDKKAYEDALKQNEQEQITLDTNKENRRNRMMKGAEMALTGLKAAAGITSLSKAMQDPDIDIPEISPLLMEAVSKQRQISESGLTSSEKNAAMQGMNDAYAGAMKNVLRASGGQRGMFLANQGTVDAQRIQGLNQLAAQDAALHRQNLQQYNQLAQSVGSMKLQRDMSAEQMKQSAIAQNKQVMSGIGANLLSDSLSDISWYLNPNRDLIEKGQRASYEKFLDLQNQGAKFDDYEYDVTGNNLRKKEKE